MFYTGTRFCLSLDKVMCTVYSAKLIIYISTTTDYLQNNNNNNNSCMPPHLIGHLVDRKQRIDKCLPNSNFHVIRETIWMLRYEA